MNDDEKTKEQLMQELARLRRQVAELEQVEDERKRAAESLQQRNDYLAALHEATLGLIGRLELTDLLQAIIKRASALANTPHGYVYLLEPGDTEMELRVGIGIQSEAVGHRIKPGQGVAGHVWKSGRPLIIDDYKNWPGRPPGYEQSVLQSAVGVPLKSGSQVVGVIGLAYLEEQRQFGESEIQLLGQFAELASVALDNAWLYAAVQRELVERKAAEAEREQLLADVERRAIQLYTAAEVSRAISSVLNIGELLPKVVNLIRDRFDLYYVGLFLVDEGGKWAVLHAGTGWPGKKMLESGHKLEVGGASMIGWCIANAQPRIALDVGEEAVRFDNPFLPDTRSELALPLAARGRVIGAMTVQSAQEAAFSNADITTLQTMTDQVANAIENARLFQEGQQRITELSILNEISQALSSALELDALLNTVDQQVSRVFDTTNFFIGTYQEGSNELVIVLYRERGQRQPSLQLTLGAGVSSSIIHTRKPIVFHSRAETIAFHEARGITPVGDIALSWMGVPLMAGGEIVGVIAIQSYEHEDLYSEQDLALFSTIAAQAAIAMQNARLFEESRKRIAQTQILLRVSEMAASTLDRTEVMRRTAREAALALGADMGGAYVVDKSGQNMRPIAGYHVPKELLQDFMNDQSPLRGGPFTEEAYQQRRTVFSSDVANDPRVDEHIRQLLPAQSALLSPMITKDVVIGGLWLVWWKKVHRFTEDEQRLIEGIMRQAGVAVENAHLFEETRKHAEEMAILNELSRSIATCLSVETLLDEVYRNTSRLLDTTNFYIALYKADKDEITFGIEVTGKEIEKFVRARRSGKGLTEHIIRNRKPVLIRGNLPEQLAQMGIEMIGRPAQSWLGVPLLIGERILGVMAIQDYATPHAYDEHDQDILTNIAAQTAITLQNARLFEEARLRAEEMATLNRIADTISRSLELHSLLKASLEQVVEALGFDAGMVSLYDEKTGRLYLAVQQGMPEAMVNKLEQQGLGGTLCEWVFQTGEILDIGDVRSGAPIDVNGLLKHELYAYAGVPLSHKTKIFGTLCLFNHTTLELAAEKRSLLQTIGQQIGAGIENARLFEEARRRAWELAVLNELGQALTARLTTQEVLEEIYRQTSRLLDATNFYIALYDPEKEEIRFVLDYTDGEIDMSTPVMPAGKGMAGYIISNRQPLLITEDVAGYQKSLGMTPVGKPALSYLGAPLILGDQVLGAMAVQSYTTTRAYDERERDLLVAIANQTVIALQNARLFEETRARAHRERILREITTRVRSSADPDAIVRTAVRELGAALGRRAFVRLGSTEQLVHPPDTAGASTQPVPTGNDDDADVLPEGALPNGGK